MGRRIACLALCLLLLLAAGGFRTAAADGRGADARTIADGILAWKKCDVGAQPDGCLLNDAYLALAGTTPGDWYPIGLGRLSIADNYAAYLAVIRDRVQERYREPGKLSAAKATEWHRITLAVLAMGGDPTSLGTDADGNPIDLIADGTYDRGRTTPLGRQGINGWIWGLIALDSLRYPIPDGACYTRDDIILEILRQQLPDGGFVHSFVYDPDNPTSSPDRSNTMAGEQTLCAMAALWRQANGMRTLYDFRAEQSDALRTRIAELERQIAGIGVNTDAAELTRMLTDFYALPEGERSYVNGYWTLSDAARAAGVDIDGIADTTPVTESPGTGTDDRPLLFFSLSDRAAVDALPDTLTTEQYVTVTTLLDKLRQSEDFEGKEDYLARLTAARQEIAAIQAEIDSINADVREKLYPFEGISLKDKKTVDSIVARYRALSEYDRAQIERWEDVIKTQTKLDNLLRGIVIGGVLCVAAAVTAVLLVRRIRRRRHRKERELEELAAEYRDE